MVRTEQNGTSVTPVETVTSNVVVSEGRTNPVSPVLRAEVDSMIEQTMTDLWLILAGDGLNLIPYKRHHDGRAFAMIFNNQLCLLSPKLSALDALRSVGLDLAVKDPQYQV